MSNNLIEFDLGFVDAVVIGGGADDDGSYDDGFSDGKSAGFAEGEAFGKQNAPTDDLSVTLTSNGSFNYPKPNDKYYADVAINVNVPSEKTPTQEKSKTITKNGTEVISPDDGYALSKVTVVTQIPERLPTQTKTIDIDENGTEEVTADSGYALEKVIINTDIDTRLPEQEKSLEVTENKVYEVTPDAGYALAKVTVTGNVASSGGGDDDGQLAKITTFNADEWTKTPEKTATFIELIKTIDWTEFNKKKHSNFFRFFEYYRGITIDVHNLDTSNATNMSNMFYSCANLQSVDVSSFNTSNVTNMGSMFSACDGLQSVDLSSFNTSNVTNMTSMFSGGYQLRSVDVSSFNTSNVTSMGSMFRSCENITSLDLSSFDTSKVTDMTQMLYNCTTLENVIFGTSWASNEKITSFEVYKSPLSKASILDLASKIADKSDTSVYTGTQTVKLKSSQKSLFTEDELTALANQFTAKNWTLAWS